MFKSIQNTPMEQKYSQLSPLRDDIYLYKYLTFDRFGQILSDKALKFNRADQLIEYHKGILTQAERRFLHQRYLENNENIIGRKEFNRCVSAYKRLCKQTYLCCFSTTVNEQMLNKYLPDGNGLVIKVFSTVLKQELNKSLEFRKPEFFEVQYIDFEAKVDDIPEGMLIFGRKRSDHIFESEIRAAIQTESKKTNPEILSIGICPNTLIDEIIVPSNITFDYQIKLLQIIEQHDLHEKASNVTFYNPKTDKPLRHRNYTENGLLITSK
jgi:hypothetical protein